MATGLRKIRGHLSAWCLAIAVITFVAAPAGAAEKVLHVFQGKDDGDDPSGSLIMDKAGNLYGTAFIGGTTAVGGIGHDGGTVYKVTPDATESVLYSFQDTDGDDPLGGVVLDAAGNIYGTTNYGTGVNCHGGAGCGVVFKLTPGGTETVLLAFGRPRFGHHPFGSLLYNHGNIYGTTIDGGHENRGVVFRLNK